MRYGGNMDATLDALIAKLDEARALLLEIDALLHEDADGATPPPPTDLPA
jgi:hypothetical protein